MAGTIDALKGKAKEVLGSATDDPEAESEGKLDQAKASVKEAAENLKKRVAEKLDEGAAANDTEAGERRPAVLIPAGRPERDRGPGTASPRPRRRALAVEAARARANAPGGSRRSVRAAPAPRPRAMRG